MKDASRDSVFTMPASSIGSKRIPTLLGLLLLIGGLIGGIFLVNTKDLGFLPRASPQTQPKNVKVTNITDTSFSVSWVSDTKTVGFIKYGTTKSSLVTTVTDDRDQLSGGVGSFLTHHVTVRLLTAQSTYYFSIGTGAKELYDENGTPYVVQTKSPISQQAQTLYGTVLTKENTAAAGALVYIGADTLSPLSVLTQSSGSFVLSLSQARDKSTGEALAFANSSPLEVFVVSPFDQSTSLIKATVATAQPLPDIILGQNLDSTTVSATPVPEVVGQQTSQAVASKFSEQLLATASETSQSVATLVIHTPEDNSQHVSKPTVTGSGPKNTPITVTLTGPTTLSDKKTIGGDGSWQYVFPKTLSDGSYTLGVDSTVQSYNQTATVQFVIAKQVATTSASTAPSPTPVVHEATPELVTGSVETTLMLLCVGILLFCSGLLFHFSYL